jgi:hypothetical protein
MVHIGYKFFLEFLNYFILRFAERRYSSRQQQRNHTSLITQLWIFWHSLILRFILRLILNILYIFFPQNFYWVWISDLISWFASVSCLIRSFVLRNYIFNFFLLQECGICLLGIFRCYLMLCS